VGGRSFEFVGIGMWEVGFFVGVFGICGMLDENTRSKMHREVGKIVFFG